MTLYVLTRLVEIKLFISGLFYFARRVNEVRKLNTLVYICDSASTG